MSTSFELTDNSAQVKSALKSHVIVALEKMGMLGERYAKEYSPVDTGRLRNSISHADNGKDTAVIGTNVEYAVYQELGTSKTKGANGGKGYLRPAVTEHISEYKSILESELKG